MAQKAQESNELRVQNRQLMEENTRLTDLTKMLLSSQAFAGFLQELSSSGVPNVAQQQQLAQQQQTQQPQAQKPQPTRKDVSTHEAAHQMQMQNQSNHMQVGMTLIPDTPIDMSIFDGHNSWNHVMPSNNYQVFALTEMPEPPKLDLSALTEKSSEITSIPSSKKDLPIISPLPMLQSLEKKCSPVDKSDDLYAEDSCIPMISITLPTTLSITLSKAAISSELLSVQSTIPGSWSDLQQICKDLDETSDRIARFMC